MARFDHLGCILLLLYTHVSNSQLLLMRLVCVCQKNVFGAVTQTEFQIFNWIISNWQHVSNRTWSLLASLPTANKHPRINKA